MASIYRRASSPFWYYSVLTAEGKWTTKSTHTKDRNQALVMAKAFDRTAKASRSKLLTAEKFREILERGMLEMAEECGTTMPGNFTKDFFGHWQELINGQVSDNTKVRYGHAVGLLEKYLPEIWNGPLSHLDVPALVQFRAKLHERMKPSSAKVILTILSIAMRQAVDEGRITKNPVKLIPKTAAGDLQNETVRRAFTLEEVRQLLEEADSTWRGMILLGAYTGQRLGDIASLQWRQIDLLKKEISFNIQKKRGKLLILPIAPQLEDWLMTKAGDDPNAYLFPQYAEVSVSAVSGDFRTLLVKSGLASATTITKERESEEDERRTTNPLSFHSLRHFTATALRSAGASEATAMAILGHASKAVARNYTHLQTGDLKPAMDKLTPL